MKIRNRILKFPD